MRLTAAPGVIEADDGFPHDSMHVDQRRHNLFSTNSHWLSESYMKSELHIFVYLCDWESVQFAAIFQQSATLAAIKTFSEPQGKAVRKTLAHSVRLLRVIVSAGEFTQTGINERCLSMTLRALTQ